MNESFLLLTKVTNHFGQTGCRRYYLHACNIASFGPFYGGDICAFVSSLVKASLFIFTTSFQGSFSSFTTTILALVCIRILIPSHTNAPQSLTFKLMRQNAPS